MAECTRRNIPCHSSCLVLILQRIYASSARPLGPRVGVRRTRITNIALQFISLILCASERYERPKYVIIATPFQMPLFNLGLRSMEGLHLTPGRILPRRQCGRSYSLVMAVTISTSVTLTDNLKEMESDSQGWVKVPAGARAAGV